MGLKVTITAHGSDTSIPLGELRELVQHARGLSDDTSVRLSVSGGDRPFDTGTSKLSVELDHLPQQQAGLLHPPGVRSSFAQQRDGFDVSDHS